MFSDASSDTMLPAPASQVKSLVDGVMQSMSSARQSEVKAWEEEIAACEHTLMLEQFNSGPIPASGTFHSPIPGHGGVMPDPCRVGPMRKVRLERESLVMSDLR